MKIHPPHCPLHASHEFWYYPKEAILFYENEGQPRPTALSAKHSERSRRQHRRVRPTRWEHIEPHGITFKDVLLTPNQRDRNAANTELVIRICIQLGITSPDEDNRRDRLLPVPKFLALFLEAKRTCMHEEQSVTQALILIQTQVLTSRIKSPT